MSVQTIKLADEAAIKIELGDGKTFTVDDPWELEEILATMWTNAWDENKKRLEADSTAKLLTYNDVRDEIRNYIQTAYRVDISRGLAEALRPLLAKAIASKKSDWLDSFKLNAS